MSVISRADASQAVAARDVFRRFLFAMKTPINAATFSAFGFTAPNFSGTASRLSDADGDWVKAIDTGGVGGGVVDSSNCLVETRHRPIWTCRFKTGSALPDAGTKRIWVGLTSGAVASADDPGTVHCLLFRYAPGADGTAFWRIVTNDGGAAENVVVTAVAIAPDTVYEMKIDATDPASIVFTINGVEAAVVAADLPSTSQPLNTTMLIRDSGGVQFMLYNNYTYEMD